MVHRLRFLPLVLILAGVAVGLALRPPESSGQSAARVVTGYSISRASVISAVDSLPRSVIQIRK